MSKEVACVTFNNYKEKIKQSFIIRADFEIILEPENNEKQNPEEFYTNNITFSYRYK